MQVSVEKTGDLERRMTVQVPAEDIETRVSSRLRELRGRVRLKGFRRGKVPMNEVEKRYGKQIREEVLQQVMQSSLESAIDEQSMRVAGVSRVRPGETSGGGDFEFSADVEIYPEIEVVDPSTIEVEKPVAEIAESDVDDMIETLREQRRGWQAVEHPAESGDRVRVKYRATTEALTVPETGHHEMAPILGAGNLFEDFEQALVGSEAGSEKTIELKFPESFRDSSLAGQTAEVSFRVLAVEASELPEVDDAFAESFGVEGGVEQLRADVRRNLERELRQATITRLKQAVTDALGERYSQTGLPASLVRQEAQQMQARVQQQSGSEQPIPLEQFTESAEKRVRIGLVMAEIAHQNEIRIDEERVRRQVQDIAETYEHPEQVVQLYNSNEQLLESVRNMVLEEQVIDWIMENANVTEKTLTFKEMMNQA